MDHATRPPRGELSDPAERILRFVDEWKATADPVERRFLLEELGYERIDRKAARLSAASRMAAAALDVALRGEHPARHRALRPVRSEGLGL